MTSFKPGDRVTDGKRIGYAHGACPYLDFMTDVVFPDSGEQCIPTRNLRPAWQECKDCEGDGFAPNACDDCPTCKGTTELDRFDAVGMSAANGKIRLRLLGPQGARHEAACRPACVVDDLMTLRFAILGGVGVGMLPDYMCHEDIADGRLERILPDWSLASGIVHAAYLSRRGMSPALRSFLDYLGEKLMQDPDDDLTGISPLRSPGPAPAANPSPPPARPGRASARGGR